MREIRVPSSFSPTFIRTGGGQPREIPRGFWFHYQVVINAGKLASLVLSLRFTEVTRLFTYSKSEKVKSATPRKTFPKTNGEALLFLFSSI